MSQLIYNGVELKHVKTHAIDRSVRLSDDGTDYMWTDFTFDVTCLFNPYSTSYPTPGNLPSETDVQVRSLLLQKRRPFYFAEGGVTILDIPVSTASGDAIDCENGPTPIACNVTRIAGSGLFFVRYVIRAAVIECPTGSVVSAIASSRYSREETIDSQYRSTIVTAGKAYFRSNVLAALQQNADAFRGYIIPNPMAGYKRTLVKAAVAPNGIQMEFMAVDVEQFIDLGGPTLPGTAGSYGITDMDLDYTASAIPVGQQGVTGIMGTVATVEASAQGAKTANTYTMLQFLIRCALNKLGSIAQTGIPTGMSVRENIFRPSVSLSLSFTSLPPPNQPNGVAIGIRGFVGAPVASLPATGGVEPQPPFSNGTRGMTAYQLAVGALAEACYANMLSVGGCDQTGAVPPDVSDYPNQCIANPQVFIYQAINDPGSPDFRKGGKQNFRGPNPVKTAYLKYTIRDDDETHMGVIQAPIANPGSSGGSLGGPQPGDPGDASSYGQVTSVALQVAKPMTRRTVSWSLTRYGSVPEVPDPTPSINGYSLVARTVSPCGLDLAPDGQTPIYRVSGVYVYASAYHTLDKDNLPFSIPPWVDAAPGQFSELVPGDFLPGIIQNPVV